MFLNGISIRRSSGISGSTPERWRKGQNAEMEVKQMVNKFASLYLDEVENIIR